MSALKKRNKTHYDHIYKAVKNNDRELFRELFLKLHTKDQTELFHLLYPEKKTKIADFIEPDEFSDIFEWLEFEDQKNAVEYLPRTYMAEVFSETATDNVSRFLAQLAPEEQQPILKMMKQADRLLIEELLSYAPRTAGAIMTKEFIYVKTDQTVSEVIGVLRRVGKSAETIYYMYVVDESMRLRGVVSLRDLIVSSEHEKVGNIMSEQVVSVSLLEDQEEVARVIQDYDLLAVPVIQEDGIVLGIVTVDDVMDVLEDETTEDFQEFSAIKPSETDEEMTISQIAKARVPWIVILVFLGMTTAGLINQFEETLQSVVALAAFIPIIMDAAGNVGTQSLAVAVREISAKDGKKKPTILETIKKEFGAGLLIGLASMVAVVIIVLVLYQDLMLAFIIGAAMVLTLSLSSVVGALVPLVATKFNIDPAIASGPFITTINDALGLFIYFSLATYFLQHLV